jgi:hypothetical protein
MKQVRNEKEKDSFKKVLEELWIMLNVEERKIGINFIPAIKLRNKKNKNDMMRTYLLKEK